MIPSLSRRLLAAAVLLSAAPALDAGTMAGNIPVQTYRDFAENRGIFAANATNVPIYDVNGALIGTIPQMMSFNGTVDGGWSALTGNQSFLATVAHNNATDLTFTGRFGATSGTPFYDTYHVINYNRAWTPEGAGPGDFAAPRLNKIVTEAVATPYLTDPTILNNMVGRAVLRVGGGTQAVATGSGTETTISGAYNYITGGTMSFSSQQIHLPVGSTLPPKPWPAGVTYDIRTDATAASAAYNAYGFFNNMPTPSSTTPLPIGGRSGDSGSPSYVFNTNTNQWEYVGADQSGSGAGYGLFTQMRSGNDWAVAVINAYNSPTITPTSGGGNITWGTPNSSGAGTFTQGSTTWSYIGLASNIRGATDTLAADGVSTTAATDAQMDATRNLVLGGAGGTIVLGGSIDMGAGSLTFNSNYTLSDGGVTTRRLNSAGFIVNAGVTLTDNLTGASGDEWRKMGAGTWIIGGTGNNAADLNVGDSGLVQLNRTSGYAAHNVTLNGGAVVVRLMQANQISGDVIFGHEGGTLDLYGQNWTTNHITHLDNGALFANTHDGTTSTFTYTGSGAQSYLGGFLDGGSLANGLLNLVYNPTTAPGSVLNISGITILGGTVTVSGGELRVQGAPTLHAGGYIDPNDWQTAVFNTGAVSVASGATFTAADHANVTGNISVAGGGTFQLLTGGSHTGSISLGASNAAFIATLASGSATETGAITGTGSLNKNGAGTLNLTNTGNTFSGAKTINGGAVIGSSLAALGDTTTNKWTVNPAGVIAANGATAAQLKAKLATTSTGTLALAGTNPDAAPDLTGYSGLSLGAIGAQTVGTAGTSSTLTAWNGTGWNLGGGGGTLTMNLKLAGAGALTAGNGQNLGTVVLTGNNTYTGGTTVNAGVILRATSSTALGSGTNNLAVNYGAILAPGAGSGSAAFARITAASAGVFAITGSDSNAYSLSSEGLNALALGADGTATYSGTLTPGTGGYKFGGNGALTVTSALSGTNALSADGQGYAGGVTTLTGANSFTGTVTVQGGAVNGVTGSHTLRAGSSSAFGSGNALVLNDGGTLDLNGYAVSSGTLTGTAASALTNGSATTSTLTLNEASSTTMAGAVSGAIALVKNGAGTLTLSGDNTQTGAITVNAGSLKVGSLTALGAAGNVVGVVSGATLDLNGNRLVPGTAAVVSGSGSGAGAIINSSTAKGSIASLTLASDTTFNYASSAGKIILGADDNSGVLNLAGYTLTKNGTGTLIFNGLSSTGAGNIVVNAGTLQLTDDYNDGRQQGVSLTGTGSITLNSGGKMLLQPWDSGLTLSMNLVLNGGTLGSEWSGPNGATVASNIAVTADSAMTFNGGYGNVNFSGVISGTGALTIGGDGETRTFSGANTYTGDTTVSAGILKLSNALALQNSTLATGGVAFDAAVTSHAFTLGGLKGSGNLALSDTAANAIALTVGGNGQSTTYSGVLSGAGSFVKTGTGTLTLSGADTYTGGTTLGGGTIIVGNSAAFGSGAISVTGDSRIINTNGFANNIAVASGKTLTVGGGYNALSGVISGAGNVTATDSVRFAGNNTFTGNFTVTGGYVTVANDAGFGAATNTVTYSGGSISTFQAPGAVTLTRNITLAGNVGIDTNGKALTLSGILSGSGSLSKNNGSDLATLSGANTYTGGTTVSVGTLKAGNNAAFSTGALTLNGGLLDVGGMSLANAITLSGGTLTGAGTVTGVISGSGMLTYDSAGNTLNINKAGTFTGGTTIKAGTLQFNANPVTTGTTTLAGGTLALGNIVYGNAITVGAGNSGTILAKSLSYVGGAITGGGNLTLTTGTSYALQLNGSLAGFTGAVTMNTTSTGGIVSAAAGSSAASYTVNGVTFDANGTYDMGALAGTGKVEAKSNTATTVSVGALGTSTSFSGVLQNNGTGALALTKVGAGTLTLSGANTYTGATNVNAGTLLAGSNTAFGTGAVNVNSGGTANIGGRTLGNTFSVASGGRLTGAGTFTGTVTVASGGTLTPGVGIQTFNNGVTLASGATFLWNLTGTGGVAGTDFDRLVVAGGTGTLTGSILKISAAGIDYSAAYWNSSHIFDIVTKSGSGALTGGFASLDTSGAGSFSADGTWSVTTAAGGVQEAVWTASTPMMTQESPPPVQAVPEPSTYGLIGAGALAAAAMVRRRRRAA